MYNYLYVQIFTYYLYEQIFSMFGDITYYILFVFYILKIFCTVVLCIFDLNITIVRVESVVVTFALYIES